MTGRSSPIRWLAFLVIPPAAAVAAFAVIVVVAEEVVRRDAFLAGLLRESWALDHVWPVVFGWLLVAFHLLLVLPIAFVRIRRRRGSEVPLKMHALLSAVCFVMIARGSADSFVSDWLIGLVFWGVPMAALFLCARACVPSRSVEQSVVVNNPRPGRA